MPKRIKPSPAMVVALLALFVALGGGAYAATNLPRNSVGTRQLRNQAVTIHKLAFNSVGTRRIQNNAVDLFEGQESLAAREGLRPRPVAGGPAARPGRPRRSGRPGWSQRN